MLTTATDLDNRQKVIARRGLTAARAARSSELGRLVGVVAAAQSAAAYTALAAVPRMLAEQGIDADAMAETNVRALTYTASDGRSLDGLMDFAKAPTTTAAQFDMIVLTQLADVVRSASTLGAAVRPKATGYVRMLSGNGCSRCAVLAGKFTRNSIAFERHPNCQCRNIPSSENVAGSITTDPDEYFRSLPTAEDVERAHPGLNGARRRELGLQTQEDVFTKAGAEAIRNGADIGKVVNARAGMTTSQAPLRGRGDRYTARGRQSTRDVFGRPMYTTTEGVKKGQKVRLMPESIVQLAGGDRVEMLRLLKFHGYIV